MSRVIYATAAAWLLACTSGAAQTVLTLEATIARARDQGGAVLVARARIAESEAALLDAGARFRENPVVEGAAGPRVGRGVRATDVEVGVSQQFETGGQRQTRLAAARAGVDRQRSEVGLSARRVVFDAASAFLDGLAAMERLGIAEQAGTVGREVLAATERRFALGDVAAIDVNLARIDAARASGVLAAARADLAAAVGTLRTLLRLPADGPLELRGSLDAAAPPPIDAMAAGIDQRPEFAVLAAEAREADAQAQLGHALRRPDLGVRVGYEREEANTIVMGGLTITWPAFQRGQGTVAAGTARASRARLEADVARTDALAELRSSYAVYQERAALAAALQRDTTATLEDNEQLARRSYETGEMNLLDMLLIRRDAVDTRLMVIDRRHDAARARLSVDLAAGVLR